MDLTKKIMDKLMSILALAYGGYMLFSIGGETLSYIGAVIGLGFGIYDNFKEPR